MPANKFYQTGYQLGMSKQATELQTLLSKNTQALVDLATRQKTILTDYDNETQRVKTTIEQLTTEMQNHLKQLTTDRKLFLQTLPIEWEILQHLGEEGKEHLQSIRARSMAILQEYQDSFRLTIRKLQEELNRIRLADQQQQLHTALGNQLREYQEVLTEQGLELQRGYSQGCGVAHQIEQLDDDDADDPGAGGGGAPTSDPSAATGTAGGSTQ